MSWRGYVAVVALLGPSLAMAFVGPLSFSAQSLAVKGPSVLEGHMAALEAFTPNGAAVPGWTFRIEGAGRLERETEYRLGISNVSVDYGRDEFMETVHATGEWRGLQWTNNSFVFVRDLPGHPSPTVTLDPVSTRLAAPAPGCVQAMTHFSSMKVPPCRNVGGATSALDGQGRVEVRVRGAFQFVAWGWVLENGTTSIVTGPQEEQSIVEVLGRGARFTNKTSVLATYLDGDLTLDVDAHGLRNLLIEDLRVRTDGVILVEDARDLLTERSHGNLQLEGTTALAVRPEQSRLAIGVVEHGTVAVVTSPALPEAAAVAVGPAAGDDPTPWPLIAVSVVLMALVAVALLWWRRASTPLSRISRALDQGRHDQALAAAAASGLPEGSRRVLEAIALIKAGRLDEAKALVEDPASGLDEAARHYLLATVAAGREDDEEARLHLDACFQHDPAYRLEAAMNSQLRHLLDLGGPRGGRGTGGRPHDGRGGPDRPDPAGGREAYA